MKKTFVLIWGGVVKLYLPSIQGYAKFFYK